MKKITRTDLVIIAVVLAIIAGFAANSVFGGSGKKTAASSRNTSYTDYNGKRIGVETGTIFEQVAFEYFPDSEYYYYDTDSDLMAALINNKIDAFLTDEPVARLMCNENSSIGYIRKPIIDDDYSFGFSKKNPAAEKYLRQFNEMLSELRSDGELDRLKEKWTSADDSAKTFDNSELSGENGTIDVAIYGAAPPFAYVSDNETVGYAIELITMFARKYGYSIEVEDGAPAACLSGISSGKYDIFAANVSVTEERKEMMNFSDTVYEGGVVVVARADELADDVADDPLELNASSYTIGAATGSAGMFAAEELLPEANMVMYDDNVTAYEAVRLGKIDAYIYDREQMQNAVDNGLRGVRLMEKDLGEPIDVSVGISRKTSIPDLKGSLDRFIASLRADGTLDDMMKRWREDKNYDMPDIPAPSSPDMKIVIGTTGIVEPYSFYRSNELTGFDIELSKRFALYMNAEIEFKTYTFAGIIAAASSNDIDCIFSNLNVTKERKEKIDFSVPVYTMRNTAMVRDDSDNAGSSSRFSSLKDSFRKNFIREDRYKLIIRGTKTTCYITFMSVLFGTILAFLICMFRRTDSILAGFICDLYVKLVQGTPVVVLLMIMYYIVFEKSDISAERVAVIGFAINFSAYASEILRSGIEGVDRGQREAALALGYSENQAFFRFIFPQAAIRSLPVYRGEIISLLKNTSIVGYIAVQDLNKMSDIIRSRTYEAFFPLIVTALIYFILAWIISIFLNFLLKRLDPKRRKRKFKGAVNK